LVLLSRFSAHAASAKQGDCPGTFEMDIVSVSDKNEIS
jgi:hypothetical protein